MVVTPTIRDLKVMMKPLLKTAAVWTTVLLSVSLISACTKEPPAPPPTTATQLATTPTPTTSPSPAADVAEAQEAAKALAIRYQTLMNKIDMDPNSVTNDEIDAITISKENARALGQRDDVLRTGERSTGPTRTTAVLAREVKFENSAEASQRKIPVTTVVVCWDFTGTGYVDKDGKSLVAPGTPTTGIKEFKIANYNYPDKTQWRVFELTSIKPGVACPEK